jgi:DNA-binding transcriptional ArsR family regulator
VLELELTTRDMANLRFTYSPVWEAVASVLLLKSPDGPGPHRSWAEHVTPRLTGIGREWRRLSALVPVSARQLPGFLSTPRPALAPDLGAELAVLRATPAAQVRAELEAVRRGAGPATAAGTGWLTELHADPERQLAVLAEAVEGYWEVALAPYWPRVRELLESELLYRARQLAEGGAERLLTGLDPAVHWTGEYLAIDHRAAAGRARLGGRGLLLTPSAFGWPRVFSKVGRPYQPILRYPARGVGTLWEARREAPDALARVLGRSRARLLAELTAPATTGTLAQRTGLTPGGVSQHLTALRDAGLLTAHRTGRQVLYARTAAAEALLQAGPPGPA